MDRPPERGRIDSLGSWRVRPPQGLLWFPVALLCAAAAAGLWLVFAFIVPFFSFGGGAGFVYFLLAGSTLAITIIALSLVCVATAWALCAGRAGGLVVARAALFLAAVTAGAWALGVRSILAWAIALLAGVGLAILLLPTVTDRFRKDPVDATGDAAEGFDDGTMREV